MSDAARRRDATHDGRGAPIGGSNGGALAVNDFDAEATRFSDVWQRRVPSPPSPDAGTVYAELRQLYDAPFRKYHNFHHIQDCLRLCDEVSDLLIDRDDKFVHYRAPTRPGNSGGPVFDRGWNLVALHHAGHEAMPRLNGHPGRYPANEGIWIEAIRRKLNEAGG